MSKKIVNVVGYIFWIYIIVASINGIRQMTIDIINHFRERRTNK